MLPVAALPVSAGITVLALTLLAGGSFIPSSASAQTPVSVLPEPIGSMLKQSGIPESAVGVYVRETGTSTPFLSINANTGMNPASVMKLVTTFAALELLGPAYTWKTEIYTDGTMEGDRLHGDLLMKGYGDPKLNLENFWLLARRLRQTGLREITGDLVLDSSYFDLPASNPAGFDGKPYRAYNIPPEALLVNYRTMSFRLVPYPAGKTVRIIPDPLPELVSLQNNLKLTQHACNEWRDAMSTEIQPGKTEAGQPVVVFNGQYSIHCGEKQLLLGLHDSPAYTFLLFKQLWNQQSGVIHGKVRTGIVPEGKTLLETWSSPPLAEIVRDINKFSNNIAARQLYLATGVASAEKPGPGAAPATLEKSHAAVREWLASKQLDFPELVIENGAGLSRKERISAQHMGELLLAAWRSRVMPEFISSMPVTAMDGTMKKRMNHSDVAGQAHIKTGLLEGVKTMAGYVLAKSGKRMVVVFLVNHPKAGNAQPAMDTLLQWVYEQP